MSNPFSSAATPLRGEASRFRLITSVSRAAAFSVFIPVF